MIISFLSSTMMGIFSQATFNRVKPRASVDAADDKAPSDTEPDDTSILSVPFPHT